ncbi:MAG: Uma2 family endonuclease [Pyrinomonadaceae bacterium]
MNIQTTTQPRFTQPHGLLGDDNLYPESHDTDMGESSFHQKLIWYLFGALESFFLNNSNVLVAANMNLYYEEGSVTKYYTPDIMVSFGTAKGDRQVYKLWEEGVFPQVIFEVASGRTWKNDIGEKAEFYDASGVEEYYLIDAERKYLPLPLMAYRRQEARLQYVPLQQDRIFSPLLNLDIVDTGKSFRLFDRETREFLQAILPDE